MKYLDIIKGGSAYLDANTILVMAYMYISKKNNGGTEPVYRWEGRIETIDDWKKEISEMKPGKEWLWPGIDGYALKYAKVFGSRTGQKWLTRRIQKAMPWSLFLQGLYVNNKAFWPLDNYVTELGEHIDKIESPKQLLALNGKRISRARNQSNTKDHSIKAEKIIETNPEVYEKFNVF